MYTAEESKTCRSGDSLGCHACPLERSHLGCKCWGTTSCFALGLVPIKQSWQTNDCWGEPAKCAALKRAAAQSDKQEHATQGEEVRTLDVGDAPNVVMLGKGFRAVGKHVVVDEVLCDVGVVCEMRPAVAVKHLPELIDHL